MQTRPLLTILAVCLCLFLTSFLDADEPLDQVDGLTFREPFSGLSASEVESKLIVFLITNEDPFAWTEAKLDKADKNRLGGGPDVWCGADFRRAFEKLFEGRPDLKNRCIVQRVVAGLPTNLTGGRPRALPQRAIVGVCDGEYRLLSFAVGVPQAEDLIRLIEDAEENRTLLSLHEDNAEQFGTETVARTRERVRRVYREALDRLVEQFGWDESLYQIDQAWVSKFANLVSELKPIFLFDAKLRFGLNDASDLVRLVVLEQHCETRRDWCETISPFLIGRPMRDVIEPIVDTTWGVPTVLEINQEKHEDLLRWFSSQRDQSIVVLSIQPALLDRSFLWPPPNISGNKNSKRDWIALEITMSRHLFRSVTAEELAVLLQANQEPPIDLFVPARARYIFFEPNKKKPVIIRESDIPGKFFKRLEKE